jgi:hypothetical protein
MEALFIVIFIGFMAFIIKKAIDFNKKKSQTSNPPTSGSGWKPEELPDNQKPSDPVEPK